METFLLFLLSLMFFHTSEFLITAVYNRADLSHRSFLLSVPYCIAMGAACIEYTVERRLFSKAGSYSTVVSWLGLGAVILGEAIRKAAMVTAKHNFTHLIQLNKRDEHQLVLHGIYRWVRHPGYMGWFLWAVGTQVLLCNPLCTLGFAATAWYFFSQRIPVEERLLVKFFGAEYLQYQARVPSGIPFIS